MYFKNFVMLNELELWSVTWVASAVVAVKNLLVKYRPVLPMCFMPLSLA